MRYFAPFITSAVLCSSIVVGSALADSFNPPPPTLDTLAFVIPKHLRLQFNATIYPNYLMWLSDGNSAGDSLLAFQLYLMSQPMTRFERQCYTMLYMEIQSGG